MRASLAVLMLALLAAMAFAPGASARDRRPCVARGDTVLVRGDRVVVTQRPSGATHACARRSRRRTRLDSGEPATPFATPYVERAQVQGSLVAYVTGRRAECSSCAGAAQVRLLDARTGRRRPVGTTGCEGAAHVVGALVLDAAGRLGWTCFRSGNVDRRGDLVEVRKLDRDGSGLLASSADGTGVRLGPLTLAGGVLTWLVDGEPRSATLR